MGTKQANLMRPEPYEKAAYVRSLIIAAGALIKRLTHRWAQPDEFTHGPSVALGRVLVAGME